MRMIVTGLLMGLNSWNSSIAQTQPTKSVDQIAAEIGLQTIRGVDTDICYPATAEEYASLGKNAILMLKSSSAISTELPLRTAYLVHRGVRIPLQRVALTGKAEGADGRATQYSFYLLPIHYVKLDTKVVVDFASSRSGFGVTSFAAKEPDDVMPAFARLDEYDTPQDADMGAVRKVLVREYPDQAVLIQ